MEQTITSSTTNLKKKISILQLNKHIKCLISMNTQKSRNMRTGSRVRFLTLVEDFSAHHTHNTILVLHLCLLYYMKLQCLQVPMHHLSVPWRGPLEPPARMLYSTFDV